MKEVGAARSASCESEVGAQATRYHVIVTRDRML